MNKDAEQLLRVIRREKKSCGNKDAEQLLRVRDGARRAEGTRTQRNCLE